MLLGREARPGEMYNENGGQATATDKGEVLQGAHVAGRSLRDVRRLPAGRGVTISQYPRGRIDPGSMLLVTPSQVHDGDRVAEVRSSSATSVAVIVGQVPHGSTDDRRRPRARIRAPRRTGAGPGPS